MKKCIGHILGRIGSKLWVLGGFWKADEFTDLNIIGKIGYSIFCTGFRMMGLRPNKYADVIAYIHK